jgi:hypothetical protein
MITPDRLDDIRREKGEPDQPADIVFGEALALPAIIFAAIARGKIPLALPLPEAKPRPQLRRPYN